MKVLVACEFSGRVRDAFLARGHYAWSCDLEPAEGSSNWHFQGDIFDVLDHAPNWDLLIAFPPCTYLTVSGNRWVTQQGRPEARIKALNFVRRLLDFPIDMIALENPVGCISRYIRKPDQIIQPWQFGHAEQKTTCLWLKNLPELEPTKIVEKLPSGRWVNQTMSGQNNLSPSKDRQKNRSRTYTGIAQAMAEQWGSL